MMKQLLLFLLVSVPLKGKAQFDYENLDANTLYTKFVYSWHSEYGRAFDCSLLVDRTYEKNGKLYRMVIGVSDDQGMSTPLPPSVVDLIGVRMADGRIYVDREEYTNLLKSEEYNLSHLGNIDYIPYPETNDGELVIYDFNMQPGDKYPSVEGHKDVSVSKAETIVTDDGTTRRMLTLSNNYILIEGIGCINSPGLLFSYLNPHPDMMEYATLSLLGVWTFKGPYTETTRIYNRDTFIPLKISSASIMEQKSHLFDLQGRRLTQKPAKGVYIQDGKKVVVK